MHLSWDQPAMLVLPYFGSQISLRDNVYMHALVRMELRPCFDTSDWSGVGRASLLLQGSGWHATAAAVVLRN